MPTYRLILGALAVWRVTHLLTSEAGPWDLFLRLRRLSDNAFWRGLLGCFYCFSLWVAAPAAYLLAEQWKERVLLWLALSGASILLERSTLASINTLTASYAEDKLEKVEEEKHVLR